MFAKWLEEYQKQVEKLRFISKLSAFFIAIFSFLSLYYIFKFFSEYPQSLESLIEESRLIPSVTFQILIMTVFSARFVLLFFKSRRLFLLNQVLYFVGLAFLATYWFVSRPNATASPFGIYETYSGIFRHASRSFDTFGLYYLVLSPIRQFITVIISLIKIRGKKDESNNFSRL